jgi:hypothetical protein
MQEIAPLVTSWTHLWQAAIPRFRPESLYFAGTSKALGGYVQPLRNMYPPSEEASATFDVLSADSPDGRYKLVFDWYLSVEEEDGEIDISGEPDSAPLLLDMRDSLSSQFATCGSSCEFNWGAWITPTEFVLAGWTEVDAAGKWRRGTLSVYSIPDSTEASYVTRDVSSDEFSRYRAAWENWVAERYRARTRHARSGEGADLAKVAAVAR